MAALQRKQIQIRDVSGGLADIPNNDIAKVMYYLNCACYCVDYSDNDVRRFTNYDNWASLSNEEDYMVFLLALILSPDILLGKVFFPSDALSRDTSNRFYEISQVNHQLVVASSLVIAGRTCRVNRILAFKQMWLQNNYLDPMSRLAVRFRRRQSTRACVIS